MKKLLFSGAFLISFIISGIASNAQDIAFYRSSTARVNPYPDARNKIVSELEVSTNAVRDFKRDFPVATDVKWLKHEKGASVYFTDGGVKMRSTYNSKGRKEYTLKYYQDEAALPSDLRHYVRSNYYDHTIALVTEVQTNNLTYYLVKMENEKEYLTLRIINDESTVFERIDKRK